MPETKGKRLEDIQAYFQSPGQAPPPPLPRRRTNITGDLRRRSRVRGWLPSRRCGSTRSSPRRRPTFSVEFFPPKTEEATEQLYATARELRELEPDFVSVTYGAGGSTRDGTVEITKALKDELGFETMAHLSCVGETTEGLATTLDRIEAAGIENVFALRGDPPRGRGGLRPARGRASAAPPSWPPSSAPLGLRGRRRLLPGGPPRGARPRDRPRLPEDQGRRRRRLPDHPALLRQPGLLRLRRAARAQGSRCRSWPG